MTITRNHPRTGAPLLPLGTRRDGSLIWPILGAAEGDGTEGEGGDGAEGDGSGDGAGEGAEGADGTEGEGELGDKGKQAIDRMKEQRNAARAEAREFKALGMSPAEIKKILDAKSGEGEGGDQVDADKIREEARREARTEALKERAADKIEVHAAKKFADADDAVAILLRKHDIEDFLDGDKVDAEAIQDALDELLEKKPHLAAQGSKRFTGGADGGKRKADRPDQLTRADLAGMSPEAITKAKAEGRLADLLGTK